MNKYLALAVAMRMNRGDWSGGYNFVIDALKEFTIETEIDKEIAKELKEIIDDDYTEGSIDGRCFRDCAHNYDWIYENLLTNEQKEVYVWMEEYVVVTIGKIEEPTLIKNSSTPLDYKELTFKDFLIIQSRAQEVANRIGYSVYLVGSALTNSRPRNIDLSIIIPATEYIKKYSFEQCAYRAHACLQIAFYKEFPNIEPLISLTYENYPIDLKICPDNWWTDKEKMILASPELVRGRQSK